MSDVVLEVLPGGKVPKKAHPTDSCWDCFLSENVALVGKGVLAVDLGFSLELPEHLEAQIRGRSGLASKGILCHFGTIDSDYRGPVKAILINTRPKTMRFKKGERIAQLAIVEKAKVSIKIGKVMNNTQRGLGGFGSTGLC